jgi:glucose-1-phosphate cytidylyltransferase
MKALILAGGLGTRLSEETATKPKPMVEIGGRPILWHIMKIYEAHGITDFVILCGYKSYAIKEYFNNLHLHNSNVTFDYRTNTVEFFNSNTEPWTITLLETGESTMVGGRILRAIKELRLDQDFMLTYGDGVSNVNIAELLESHKSSGKLATVTAVRPPGRFGALHIEDGSVTRFIEKPDGDGSWINGGFFVLSPKIQEYIDGDETVFEQEPLMNLARDGQLNAFKHEGFWQPMDTLRDKHNLEELLASNKAPWKVWQ